MINVNEITTTLRGMPDRLLQQYAMMNKANPYVLSLAVAESNQRKQLRQAAQARMAAPQPKVADAAIAGMAEAPAVDAMGNVTGMAAGGLPEDYGIGRLPAHNIQHMADGGIAGYGDGDDVPKRNGMAMGGMFDFAQRSEPVVRMSGGGHIPRYQGVPKSMGGDGSVVSSNPMFNIPGMVAAQPRETFTQQGAPENTPLFQRIFDSIKAQGKEATLFEIETRIKKGIATPEEKAFYQNEKIKGGDVAATNAKYPPQEAVRAKDFPGVQPGFEKLPAETQPPAPPPAPTAQQGLGSIPSTKVLTPEQAKTQAGDFVDFSESRTALKQAESDQETQGARMRTMLAEGLPKTPALQGLEKLLDKQDAETGGEKDKAAGLALLTAGLAIAGGSSQFALQNLKEAIPAVAQYGDALKDIKKMERENMKMRGEIEQARRAEDRDNTKLKLELEDKIAGRKDTINKLGIDLTAKIAGTTAEVASKLWSTSYDAANREKVAGIAALAGSNAELNKYAQLGAADPNSALAKGFQMYKQEGAEPRLYSEYIKLSRDPIDGAAFRERYPSFEIFKEGYSGGSIKFAAPPANAAILKPPKG